MVNNSVHDMPFLNNSDTKIVLTDNLNRFCLDRKEEKDSEEKKTEKISIRTHKIG